MRATDFAGNTSSVMVSDGFQIDATAPAIGIVYDGLEVDQAFTSSGDTLKGSWSGFNDDGSGIEYFLYAAGTSAGGNETVDWTSVSGQVTSFLVPGLSLSNAQKYYISVIF